MSVFANSMAVVQLTNLVSVMVVANEFSTRMVALTTVKPEIRAYCDLCIVGAVNDNFFAVPDDGCAVAYDFGVQLIAYLDVFSELVCSGVDVDRFALCHGCVDGAKDALCGCCAT